MPVLTRSQLGLLNLMVKEHGAGIALVQRVAASYGVEEGRLGPDLLRLVEERLIWPAGTVHPSSFLPSFFLPSPEGHRLVETALAEDSQRVPPPDLTAINKIRTEYQASPVPPKMPALQALPREVVMTLAEAYLYWAQKPPTEAPRTSSHQLYVAAAWGYAQVGERERYSRCLRAGLKAWTAEGHLGQLATVVGHLVEAYPDLTETTLEMAIVVLEPPSRLLRQKPSLELDTVERLTSFADSVSAAARSDAGTLKLRLPDAHYLIEVGLTLEKMFAQAFALQSKPLYVTATQLLLLTIRQARSMIDLGGKVGVALPMVVRMTLGAEQIALAMEGFAELIESGPEQRKRVGLAAAALARALLQATVIPLSHLVNIAGRSEAQAAQWTVKMMYASERGLALRVARPLLYLERLTLKVPLSEGPSSGLEYLVSESELEDLAESAMAKIEHLPMVDPRAGQFVPLSGAECEVLERVVDYVRLAQVYPLSLSGRCEVLRSSTALQFLVDRALRPMLSDMRQVVLNWMVNLRQAEGLSALRKAELLRQLGEIEKANTPSQYLFRIPGLIESWEAMGPGEVVDTWNSWLDNVRRSEIL